MSKTLPLFLLASLAVGQKSVHYRLQFPNAVHHEAEIRATFTGVSNGPLEIHMSRSSPGRYALHEFAKNVYNFRARDESGNALKLVHTDPSGWSITPSSSTVIVDYTLYGNHADGTYAAIDDSHAHLNLPATLVWARGFENAPATVSVEMPPNSNWTVATEMTQSGPNAWSAPNLDRLMDSPMEISNHAVQEWKIEDAVFRLALHSEATEAQIADFAKKCKTVVLEERGVFGAFPKYDAGAYTFLVDLLPWVVGDGMEHRDSTVIAGKASLGSKNYMIGAVSHEFFHSWNVKRIRPRSLEPFDFDRADMSGELWFAEGFTNYYGELVLARSGLATFDELLYGMGEAVSEVLTAPGREVHSAVEMSQLAPFVDAARSVDVRNFANTAISYYTYGQALALGIDFAIRQRFPGKTLDDWMRTMWREHPDVDRPYTLADLQTALAETTGDSKFAEQIFSHHISGREPLDYASLLTQAGLLLRPAHPHRPWLGVDKLKYSSDAVELESNSLRDGPVYNSGLDIGDRILRWDGKMIKNSDELNAFLDKRKPGDHLSLSVSHLGAERTVNLTFAPDPALEIVPFEKAGKSLTPAMESFRRDWLRSRAAIP